MTPARIEIIHKAARKRECLEDQKAEMLPFMTDENKYINKQIEPEWFQMFINVPSWLRLCLPTGC